MLPQLRAFQARHVRRVLIKIKPTRSYTPGTCEAGVDGHVDFKVVISMRLKGPLVAKTSTFKDNRPIPTNLGGPSDQLYEWMAL